MAALARGIFDWFKRVCVRCHRAEPRFGDVTGLDAIGGETLQRICIFFLGSTRFEILGLAAAGASEFNAHLASIFIEAAGKP